MTVEKAYMRGAKTIGIAFEVALLLSSMFFNSEGFGIEVVIAILLSVFSMSVSVKTIASGN